MLERMPQEVSYLYILKPSELLILTGVAVAIAVAGYAFFRGWYQRDQIPPLWAIVIAGILALALYLIGATPIWVRADAYRKLTVVLYSLVIGVIPGAYFSYAFLSAMALRSVRRITWLDTSLPGVDEFLQARELAAQGDIDGAVAMYENYPEKQGDALFAAAHLLEMNGRFQEAAEMFEKCAEVSGEQLRPWSEALFRWARLCEVNLNRPDQSIELYERLLQRAPSTELGRLASTKLVRLRSKTKARTRRAGASAPGRKKTAKQRSKKSTAQKSKK
ncbi:MAG: tetratricopeptide repeat protein [Candidatus Hydrogenedentales bacterium]|jgi:tetratricopeptide (TPR) repeat protein